EFKVGGLMRNIDETAVELHPTREGGADFGQCGLDVLEALHGLGAKIAGRAGKFSVGGASELSSEINGAARGRRFDNVRIAARCVHALGIDEAMTRHCVVLHCNLFLAGEADECLSILRTLSAERIIATKLCLRWEPEIPPRVSRLDNARK